MTKLYEQQLFLGCDARELVARMLIIDKFKRNRQKISNSLEL